MAICSKTLYRQTSKVTMIFRGMERTSDRYAHGIYTDLVIWKHHKAEQAFKASIETSTRIIGQVTRASLDPNHIRETHSLTVHYPENHTSFTHLNYSSLQVASRPTANGTTPVRPAPAIPAAAGRSSLLVACYSHTSREESSSSSRWLARASSSET